MLIDTMNAMLDKSKERARGKRYKQLAYRRSTTTIVIVIVFQFIIAIVLSFAHLGLPVLFASFLCRNNLLFPFHKRIRCIDCKVEK